MNQTREPTSFKLNVELDEHTGQTLRRLLPHGTRKQVFGTLARQVAEMLEVAQDATIIGIMQGRIVVRLEVMEQP